MKKAIKILTVIFAIILVSMVSFVGIYTQKQNRMENIMKDYEYAMDLKGARIVAIKPTEDTEEIIKDAEGNVIEEELTDEEITEKGYTKETINKNEEYLTADNFKKAKKIVEKRLEGMGVENYNISLNEQTGEVKIEIEENSVTNDIISNIYSVGKFEIVDSETEEVLLDNQYIKSSGILYSSETAGTAVILQIELNKEGRTKLEEITNTYKTIEESEEETTDTEENEETDTAEDETAETQENGEEATEETEDTTEENTQKKVSINLDGQTLYTNSFDKPIVNGTIQLTVGSASTDSKTVNEYAKTAAEIATILNTEKLPVEYEITGNEFIYPEITEQTLQYVVYAIIAISVVAIIFLVIKCKFRGLLAGISFIGYVAVYLLLLRYANVIISIEGIFAIAMAMAVNYIVSLKIAEGKDKKDYLAFISKIIPIPIFSVIFSFMEWIPIASFGKTLFWGLVLTAVFNLGITNPFVSMVEKKERKDK